MALRGGVKIKNPILLDADGRRLVAGQFIAQIGFGLSFVALPWIVLEQNGSAALSGLTATASFAPYVVFGLVAGTIGDRMPRRRLLVGSYVAQAAAADVIPLWALAGTPSVGVILAVAFLVGLGRTFMDAAMFGAVADVVTPARFVEAQAMFSAAWATGQIVGPFAAGALIAAIGGPGTIGVQACVYALGVLVVLRIRRPLASHAAGAAEPIRRAVREGILVLVRVPVLRLLTGVAAVWYVCVMGTQGLLVAYYRNELGFDVGLVGATLAVAGVSSLVGGLSLSPLSRRFGSPRLIAAGVVGSGVAALLLAAAHAFWSAVFASALLGFFVQITVASFIGERQRHAPNHLQARVGLTGRAIVVASSMTGGFIASGLATVIDLRTIYLGVGFASLTLAVWAVPAIFRSVGAGRHVEPEAA